MKSPYTKFKPIISFSLIISFILLIPIINTIKLIHLYNSNSNEITIKVKGSGTQTICGSIHRPNEIYLNGNIIGRDTNEVTLSEETSTLILKYNDDQILGTGLFSGIEIVTEIDLTGCSFSDMASMFEGCTSLTSINFLGVDSSSVQDFYNLFHNCKSLISVDLSGLDISQVSDFRDIFTGCYSLEYINIWNYDESKPGDYYGIKIDANISENAVICINMEKASTLYNNLNSSLCTVFYCGDDWKEKQQIYNEESNSFINNNLTNYEINVETEVNITEIKIDKTEQESEIVIEDTELNNYINHSSPKIEFDGDILKKFFIDDLLNNNDNITKGKINVENIIDALKEGEFKKYMEESNKTELVKITNDITYHVSTISSQSNNDDVASINLGDCEAKLRNSSGISPNEELVIFKINSKVPESKTQIIEYTIFTIDGVQLNLDICKDSTIQHNIPVDINEKDLFKYNPNSEFYNDICFQYTSGSGTDMTNYDRKNEFNEKNMALCENNCEFKEYNKDDKKVVCDCKVKSLFNTLNELDKRDLLEKFTNYKNIFNLEIFKCTKLLFSKKGLAKNIGSYIILSILFIYLINFILFLTKGYNLFIIRMNKTIEQKINNLNINEPIITKNNNPVRNMNKIKSKTTIIKSTKDKIISFPPNKRSNFKKMKSRREKKYISNQISISKDISLSKNEINKVNIAEKINKIKENMNDYEINSLSYIEAKKLDNRTFLEYYLSLIRTKHLIAFTFIIKTDYNSRLIKIISFFTSFALYYAIKALFFNDSVMHVIYLNNGVYDFIYQLPQIIYSTIISAIIGLILSQLSLTQAYIVEIKNLKKNRDKDSNEYKKEFIKFMKLIKIKFMLFFIINFILLFLFWYYLSCFCAVYKNTQVYLIKDVLISFGISLIYPFCINLFPAILRLYSLKDKTKDHKYIYFISKILQLI